MPERSPSQRSPSQRAFAQRAWYQFLQLICRLLAVVVFRIRCFGRDNVPASGGALVLANHQSNFDPVLVGLSTNRRLNYLARQTLFKFAPFRWLIDSLDAIPIDREGLGLSGLKETLRRLKRGELVLMFPEGTRTSDGELAHLKPGFCAVARRANVPLVPVGLDGAFESWPRSQKLPKRSLLRVHFGPPLLPSEIALLDDDALVAEIERRMSECFQAARESKRRASGKPVG